MSATLRAVSYLPPGTGRPPGLDLAVLRHDERRVRRRLVPLIHGDEVQVDFPEPVTLQDGGALELDDGRFVDIVAAEEDLYEAVGRGLTTPSQVRESVFPCHNAAERKAANARRNFSSRLIGWIAIEPGSYPDLDDLLDAAQVIP